MDAVEIEGWPAVLLFLGAALFVGIVMWLGVTGRIGNGKSPMTPPEVDHLPRRWED